MANTKQNLIDDEADVVEAVTDGLTEYFHELGVSAQLRTFEEAGLLTNDEGVVLRVGGRAFQITVVRSL